MKHPNTYGIALGGGGSRAFVHVGVLWRLEEEGLRPAFVAGSSMAALIGALYAAHPEAAKAFPPALAYFRKSPLFGRFAKPAKGDGLHRRKGLGGRILKKAATASVAATISFRLGLRRRHPVNRAVDDLFAGGPGEIERFPLRFAANAIDLDDGKVAEFTSGPVAPALKAGVAIGLVFAPHKWNGTSYVDAAPIAPVPVSMCRRLGAETVLAVDISSPLTAVEIDSGFDVVRRIMAIESDLLSRAEIAGADLVIRPDTADVFWADFSRIDELVERGREAAGAIAGELRDKLSRRK